MTPFMDLLTDKEYVKNKGSICPQCESSQISAYESPEVDGDITWQRSRCDFCGADWTDIYRLVGFDFNNDGPDPGDDLEILKTFDSGMTSIVRKVKIYGVLVTINSRRIWFTRLKSPKLKRIKDKKIRKEVTQALTEIAVAEKLTDR